MLIAIKGIFSIKKGRFLLVVSGDNAKNFNVKALMMNPTMSEPVSPINIFSFDSLDAKLNLRNAIKQPLRERLSKK